MTLLTHEHCTCCPSRSHQFATAANLTGGRTVDPPISPLEEFRLSLCILMSSTKVLATP